ncbi:hypothetical protein CDL15_Pgr010930 [Punica granatum]|uniref:SPARK domain-containing protein n=1 Tax=Punica granatum TaxID=22663 RepID=A0A218XN60_PUNGR|nr:hypothetical protein CDL15_Pgr010930 [Punica granatum]
MSVASNTGYPVDFTIVDRVNLTSTPNRNVTFECSAINAGLELALEEFFRRTGSFLPRPESGDSCLFALQDRYPGTNIHSSCDALLAWATPSPNARATEPRYKAIGPRCKGIGTC